MDRDEANNIKLQGMDKVRVYGMTEMVQKTFVSIEGHVRRPGRFLLQDNMTIHDLIFKSGSFLDEEYKKNTYLERADLIRVNDDNITKSIISFNLEELLESPESKSNLVLKPNDLIRVYGKSSFNSNYTVSI